jgi:hypothetical protein
LELISGGDVGKRSEESAGAKLRAGLGVPRGDVGLAAADRRAVVSD